MQKFIVLLFIVSAGKFYAQISPKDTIRVENHARDSVSAKQNPSEIAVYEDIKAANTPPQQMRFNPTKAGLYSAILPGLGQYYNRKYWKIPIVWGAIGTGVGITMWNQNQYNRYREAFIAELNGQQHEFSAIPGVDKEVLGRTQDRAKRQRDYAIAITSLVYLLNIVDAVVDAHLYEGRKDPDLAVSPTVIYDEFGTANGKPGVALNYTF